MLQQSCEAVINGALLCNLEADHWPGPDEEVRGAFLRDSDEALAVDLQKLISSLQATIEIGSTASHDRLYVNSKTVLLKKNTFFSEKFFRSHKTNN